MLQSYNYYEPRIKAWTKKVPFDDRSKEQVKQIASMPFIHKHVAIMPDVHLGIGATIGSVIPTTKAIIPAAVGVDIGCGMCAVKTSLTSKDLPESLKNLRSNIEKTIPTGRTAGGKDKGSWHDIPLDVRFEWDRYLDKRFTELCEVTPILKKTNNINHLGTLGTGNHFIEICLDENDSVWIMLHSGSRGVGNRIGSYFIEQAKKEMEKYFIDLPDPNLAYLVEGTELFKKYVDAVGWAQDFAFINRKVMLNKVIQIMIGSFKNFEVLDEAINCHHNYVTKENHFKSNVWVTRKGAVRARKDDLAIIPGSMGERSFIVKGKGNEDSFCSCSHGAGRVMSRTEAFKNISLEQHIEDVKGVECRIDKEVIDESPKAYKNIDDVMESQKDLVEIVHTLKQIVCVKG